MFHNHFSNISNFVPTGTPSKSACNFALIHLLFHLKQISQKVHVFLHNYISYIVSLNYGFYARFMRELHIL
jgi:hypothetical protein